MSQNRRISLNTEELFDAAEEGNASKINQLVQQDDTDINYKKHLAYGSSPLLIAIAENHGAAVQKLLDSGADVSVQKNTDLNTPLHEACLLNYPNIAKAILAYKDKAKEQGIDRHEWDMLSAKNAYGNTPLHCAAKAGALEIVKMLLEEGADIEAMNVDASTPLHHACYCDEENDEVIECLLKSGANVNAVDKHDSTPLMVAAKKNQVKGTGVLLKTGAREEMTDVHGRNAYYYAKHKENHNVTKQLKQP